MKILKRNQLIILIISLMLITAGYLNFTSNHESAETSMIADRDNETIGDAQLVSTIPQENEIDIIENLVNVETANNQIPTSNVINTEKEITTAKMEDFYFTTSRLDRNKMYSEQLETYQQIYNDSNVTPEEKAEALSKINQINNIKNAIMIAENLIIAKGFEDVVIFSNEGSISIVVKTPELKQEEVAQIQNIVTRELNVSPEMIHISNK